MEKETKRCPYCGEEIMAVAKKCKHCGEWIEEDESVSENNDEETLSSNHQLIKELQEDTGVDLYDAKEAINATNGDIEAAIDYLQRKGIITVEDTPDNDDNDVEKETNNITFKINIPLWATLSFWTAIIGIISSTIQECGMNEGFHGKWEFFVDIANWIPYWLTLVLGWVGEAGLISLLMYLTRRLGKPIGYIGLFLMILLAASFYYSYMEFYYILEENQEKYIAIILFTSLACYLVIGIMLISNYVNALKGLGMAFIALPIIILISTVFISAGEEFALWEGLFIDVAYLYVFKEGLTDAFNKPKETSSNSILSVGSLIIAAVAAGLFVMCDSDNSNENNETVFFPDIEDTVAVDCMVVSDYPIQDEYNNSATDETQKYISELKNFIKNARDCMEKGVPSGSTAGSHYEEERQRLWKKYDLIKDKMDREERDYSYTLLGIIDELFEDWIALDEEFFDLEE